MALASNHPPFGAMSDCAISPTPKFEYSRLSTKGNFYSHRFPHSRVATEARPSASPRAVGTDALRCDRLLILEAGRRYHTASGQYRFGSAVCPLYSSFCGPTWVDGRPSTVPPRRALNSGICGNCFPASDEVPTMFNSLRSRSAPPYGGVLFRRSAGFSGLQGVDASPCYALNCRSLFPVCTREGSRNWRQPAVDSLTHETVHGGWSLRIEVVSVASPPLGGAMQRDVAIEELDTSANVMQRGRSKSCSGFGEKVKDI